jgi:outer membrane lipoprotein SlyB
MTSSVKKQAIGTICGTIIGAVAISYAYKVQGGEWQSFAIVGAIVGAFAGFTAAIRQLRFHYLGAAIGSIASLTLFQVPVCDGSHFGMPAVGAAIGAIAGAIPESILDRRSSVKIPADQSDLLKSTNKGMDARGSVDRL